MKNHWVKSKGTQLKVTHKKISALTYLRLKLNKFTQSDYCEIVQKMILDGDDFTDKSVVKSMKILKSSKEAFKKYQKE